MVESLCKDADLKKYFDKAIQRIQYCSILDTNAIEKLQQSMLENLDKHQIINALLTIRKPKNYWKQVKSEYKIERYKDQLLLEIARFYSNQPKDSQLHIPALIRVLNKLS
jgi:hypothetical protein